MPKSSGSAALTRGRQTAALTDTLAAIAGVERGWSTEKLKWIYQVVLHLKISLCFQGHNVGPGGEDGPTKKNKKNETKKLLLHLVSPGEGLCRKTVNGFTKHMLKTA